MAFIRICYIVAILTCVPITRLLAQTIYFPQFASTQLQSTAVDMAELLQKSIPGSRFTTQSYTSAPVSGIVFNYDSTITDNQLCRVTGDGSAFLSFTAAEDNGLVFGIYQYLQELGFRFYQPGTIWEVIPPMTTAFKIINKQFNTPYKYKTWFISGGHAVWLMDKNSTYNWDIYRGENGHSWSAYQRRNGMLGANRFAGHRGDIVNGNYLATLQNNPCYVANYNGSRQATGSSVPDVNNHNAKQLWAGTIEQKYTQSKNNIYNNRILYANLFRGFKYSNQNIGIEVPDGPRWGNTPDSTVCGSQEYPSAADQSIRLANSTVQQIKAAYPEKRFQLYAYFSHANIPSPTVSIDPSLDVQVVSTAFQNETSSKGLLNRWYRKHTAVSEYHYLNIAQWSGETPMMRLKEMKQTLTRLKEEKSQGIYWEASAAKFASLPFLKAANDNLIMGTDVDSSLMEFCRAMFGKGATSVYNLLQQWSSDEAVMSGYFLKDNKFKIPHYIQLLEEAVVKAGPDDTLITQRFSELKAYLHYMILYYNWICDARPVAEKMEKAGALCLYLAKINKLTLVNSYYLISGIVQQFGVGTSFYNSYNVQTGTAYLDGSLALITAAEIEDNYTIDIATVGSSINKYRLQPASELPAIIPQSNFIPATLIKLHLGYTNGADYSSRTQFSIYAKSAGSFSVKYIPQFNMAGKGMINFTVENADKYLGIIKDTSLNEQSVQGILNINLPEAGFYTLTIVSKYQSTVDLEITTKGNLFYKSGPFTHRYAEKYTAHPESLPGYFYVPPGMQKVYFSVNNSYSSTQGYLSAAKVSEQFAVKDSYGNAAQVWRADGVDTSLFYINIPAGQSGNFWQISKMNQYFICLSNITNTLFFGTRKTCSPANFNISVIKKGDECLTRLTSTETPANLKWIVDNNGSIFTYNSTNEVVLPITVSGSAIVTLITNNNCSVTKTLSQDTGYARQKEACASGAPLPQGNGQVRPLIYPNPSNGIFRISIPTPGVLPDRVSILNTSGQNVTTFSHVSQIDLTRFPAGSYYYLLYVGGIQFTGKLIKQ